MINILAIDGGGIRGIIPALLLAEIEKQTKRPIAELFHLIAGTSTGGILALGLTIPDANGKPKYTAKQGVDLYRNHGQRIFSRSLYYAVTSLGGLIGPKFPTSGIDAVLQDYLGNTTLTEAATNVIVPSYDITERNAFFFKSHGVKEGFDEDFYLRDVARATSAAPAFFAPAHFTNVEKTNTYTMIDGGVYAGDPAMCAYVEAKRIFSEDNDFLIVSLGTGSASNAITYQKARNWGALQWTIPVLDSCFDGLSDTVDYQLKTLLPIEDQAKRYYRFQLVLPQGTEKVDDTSQSYLAFLTTMAHDLLRDHQSQITELCQQLVA